MAVRANLVLKDRAGTPVNHTFSPDGDNGNVHAFSEKTAVPAGNPVYTASIRKTTSNVAGVVGGKLRPSLKLVVPVVATQTINGVSNPVVVRTAYAEVNFTFDALSTDQERKDCVGMMADSLAASQTMINDLLVNGTDIYG